MKNPLQGMAAKIGRFRFNTEDGRQAALNETEGSGDGQTGGLKLMTVFIVVLALHLVVIGGISAWHFVKGPSQTAADVAKESAPSDSGAPTADGATDQSQTAGGTDANAPKDANVPTEGSEVTGTTPAPVPAAVPAPVAVPAAPKPVAVAPAPVKAPTPAVATMAPAAGSSVYVVKSGDTLHRIAKTTGMTVAQLKEMNHLASDALKIGQKLVVKGSVAAPVSAAPAMAPTATPAPAPASAVAAVAPAAAPAASAGMQSYTVAKGDTLTKIAKLFKVTPAAIMAANSPKLNDPKKLKIGEILTIPVKAERREVSQGPAAPAQGSGSPVPTARASSPDLVMNK